MTTTTSSGGSGVGGGNASTHLSAAQPGLSPAESAFLAEMTPITVLPRQALGSIPLLGGATPTLTPPHRAAVPLWLALLLKKQGRANILAPGWLNSSALDAVLDYEESMLSFAPAPVFPPDPSRPRGANTSNHHSHSQSTRYPDPDPDADAEGATRFSPPFHPTSTASAGSDAIPYHWLEVATLLLDSAADDVPEADAVRRRVRDVREARAAKLRKGVANLEGAAHVTLAGVGSLEVAEHRAFVTGVIDGLRRVGASREATRRERDEDGAGEEDEDDERGDEDML